MYIYQIYVALGIKPRASHMLDMYSILKSIFNQFYFDFETQSHKVHAWTDCDLLPQLPK